MIPMCSTGLVIARSNARAKADIENVDLLGNATAFVVGNSLNNAVTGNGAANRLSGATGDDTLIGNQGDDTIDGGDGADALYGGDGNDLLIGSAGNDLLDGGLGNDTASFMAATNLRLSLRSGTMTDPSLG
jgi:Ca2+-binding RTX toxin-like protein